MKQIQNEVYNYQKDSLRVDDLLVHVDSGENYHNDKQYEIQSAYFGHQSCSLFTSCCYYKDDGNILQQKSIVIVTENSDHNRVISMSSLRKIVEIPQNSLGKSFHRLIIWSHIMSVQFRSRFIFKLLASTLFLDKEISWFCNERHHRKGPVDGVGGTLKMSFFEMSSQSRPSSRPRRTLQKLNEKLCRQLQLNIYQRKLRLQSRNI